MVSRLLRVRVIAILLTGSVLGATSTVQYLIPKLAPYKAVYQEFQARTLVLEFCRTPRETQIVNTARYLSWQKAAAEYAKLSKLDRLFVHRLPEKFDDPRESSPDIRGMSDVAILAELWQIIGRAAQDLFPDNLIKV